MIDSKANTIYVSTACLPGVESVKSRVSLYKSHGLNAIELGAGVYANKDSISYLIGMKGQFLVHNYFPPPSKPFVLNLASGEEDIHRRSRGFVLGALDLTARLNAPFYSVHAGFITDPTSFGKTSFVFPMPSSLEESQVAMDRFVTALGIMLDSAEHFGLMLLVENNVCSEDLYGKLLLLTADEFLELFRILPSQHLGILLDTGHLKVTANTLDFNCMAYIERITPYIRAFHVHDNDGTLDTHQPIKPGSWVLDVLRKPEFASLPIIVEAKFDNVAELCRHVEWLRKELACD